ncbi:hypothetical protein ACSYDW_14515 [Paeniglutamicibacter sp. R2-26]|uniref:hypothetical protein n=1 Tax=Paeniglutamicibacter sp. R2-26 TaxID=3144417 RepID=UPI003EE73E03
MYISTVSWGAELPDIQIRHLNGVLVAEMISLDAIWPITGESYREPSLTIRDAVARLTQEKVNVRARLSDGIFEDFSVPHGTSEIMHARLAEALARFWQVTAPYTGWFPVATAPPEV